MAFLLSAVASKQPTGGRPTRSAIAITVASVALFTDMLVYGLAIPVLPLLPATTAAGPAATGLLFAGYATAMLLSPPSPAGWWTKPDPAGRC
jgi:MFS transporter, DHA1 family, solute carrier family 18 (vesicular amine transporter), member 1/2